MDRSNAMRMRRVLQLLPLLAVVIAGSESHPSIPLPPQEAEWETQSASLGTLSTSSPPAFRSYHVHVQFVNDAKWGGQSISAALQLRKSFSDAFSAELGAPCTGLFEQGRLCLFDVDYEAMGPFVGPQWAVFVPLDDFSRVVMWFSQHRQQLDILVHPNSAQPLMDHTAWCLWGGLPWPLNTAIFGNETST